MNYSDSSSATDDSLGSGASDNFFSMLLWSFDRTKTTPAATRDASREYGGIGSKMKRTRQICRETLATVRNGRYVNRAKTVANMTFCDPVLAILIVIRDGRLFEQLYKTGCLEWR